ncbi:unnamed protein product, partial [Rotaria magnacalcarata]
QLLNTLVCMASESDKFDQTSETKDALVVMTNQEKKRLKMLELEKNPVLTNRQRKQLDMKRQVDEPPEKRITNQERKRLEIEAGISQQPGTGRDESNEGTQQGISQIQEQVDDPPEKRITNQERKRLEMEAGISQQKGRGRDGSNQVRHPSTWTHQGISQIQEQIDDTPEKIITNQERKRLE